MAKKNKTTSKPLKKESTTITTKKVPKSLTSKKKQRKPNSYNDIQKMLSAHTKKEGIKLGKDFNKYASIINTTTKGGDYPKKYIKDNIDILLIDAQSEVSDRIDWRDTNIKRDFPERIVFYNLDAEINGSLFNNIKVSLTVNEEGFNKTIEGDYVSVLIQYISSGMRKFIRDNFNNSPSGVFVLSDTDSKTFVNYVLETNEGDRGGLKYEEVEPDVPIVNVDNIELEKEKTRRLEIELQIIKEKVKLLEAAEKMGLKGDILKKFLGLD